MPLPPPSPTPSSSSLFRLWLLPSGPTPLSPPPRELDKLPFLKTRTSYFLYFFLDILLSDFFPFRFPLCQWSSRPLVLLPCWGFLPFSHPSANSCPQAQGGIQGYVYGYSPTPEAGTPSPPLQLPPTGWGEEWAALSCVDQVVGGSDGR